MHFFNIYVNVIHFAPSSGVLFFATRTLHCSSIIPNYLSNESSFISDDDESNKEETTGNTTIINYRNRLPLIIASSSSETCTTMQFTNRLSFDSLQKASRETLRTFSSTIHSCCEYLRTLEIRSVRNFLIDLKPIVRNCKHLRNLVIGGLNEKQLLGQLASEKPVQRLRFL